MQHSFGCPLCALFLTSPLSEPPSHPSRLCLPCQEGAHTCWTASEKFPLVQAKAFVLACRGLVCPDWRPPSPTDSRPQETTEYGYRLLKRSKAKFCPGACCDVLAVRQQRPCHRSDVYDSVTKLINPCHVVYFRPNHTKQTRPGGKRHDGHRMGERHPVDGSCGQTKMQTRWMVRMKGSGWSSVPLSLHPEY